MRFQDSLVGPSPHAGLVSKSKRKPVLRARKAQPDRRDQAPARPSGSPKRVTQLSDVELLEQIKQVRIERDDAETELAMLIDTAISQGLGWPQIASQLGVTRQAAPLAIPAPPFRRRQPPGPCRGVQQQDVKHHLTLVNIRCRDLTSIKARLDAP